ncbi:MAG: flagellar hook-basal body complex protein FliE [Oligoflexales bacterium]
MEAYKAQLSQKIQNDQLLNWSKKQQNSTESTGPTEDEKSFLDYVSEGVKTVNNIQANADKMSTNLATGKQENIHETMLAISQAELSFKLMVQVRNKALEAYQEVMRMQV